jgi:hypothetical protein
MIMAARFLLVFAIFSLLWTRSVDQLTVIVNVKLSYLYDTGELQQRSSDDFTEADFRIHVSRGFKYKSDAITHAITLAHITV